LGHGAIVALGPFLNVGGKMKKLSLIALALLFTYASPAQAKIARLASQDVTDLSLRTIGKCQAGWGDKMAVTLATAQDRFVFTYCSDQPLSALLEQVYPRLRDFVAGPKQGPCQRKIACDNRGYCRYGEGQYKNTSHQLTIISNEKGQVENYDDMTVTSDTICQPVSCY
jgi:hypothetical protein